MRLFILLPNTSKFFVQICLVQTGLFQPIGSVLWVLMSTLLSAACHLVAMICIITPWFICIDIISTDKLFWYSCLQFIVNKQTNNSIQRVYYLVECLDWTRLAFRVLLLCVNVRTQKNTRCSDSSRGLRHFCWASGWSSSHKLEFLCLSLIGYKLKLDYTTVQTSCLPTNTEKNEQRNPQQR